MVWAAAPDGESIRRLARSRHAALRSNQQDRNVHTQQLRLDPQHQATPKKKRGRQPGHPTAKRRDYSHLPACEEQIDFPEAPKVCSWCGLRLKTLGTDLDRK